jgi:hypothetical protein
MNRFPLPQIVASLKVRARSFRLGLYVRTLGQRRNQGQQGSAKEFTIIGLNLAGCGERLQHRGTHANESAPEGQLNSKKSGLMVDLDQYPIDPSV